MFCGSASKLREMNESSLKINNEPIEHVDQFKDLGLIIEENLPFEAHINHLYAVSSGQLEKPANV